MRLGADDETIDGAVIHKDVWFLGYEGRWPIVFPGLLRPRSKFINGFDVKARPDVVQAVCADGDTSALFRKVRADIVVVHT